MFAHDPETGQAGPRAVTATWPHTDTLVEFEVGNGTVTTTEDHEFHELEGTNIEDVTITDPVTGDQFTSPPRVPDIVVAAAVLARIEQFLDPDLPPEERAELEEGYVRAYDQAISNCVALFLQELIEVVAEVNPVETGKFFVALRDFNLPASVTLDDISEFGWYEIKGDARHVCEGVPVYLPGSVSSLGGNNSIVEATLHMSEALGTIDASGWTNPFAGPQPAPRPEWQFLTREVSTDPNRRNWLATAGGDFGCRGSHEDDDQCDEWPWAATQQGGFNENLDLRPHLRIINASENSRSGAELGQFYSSPRQNVPIACGVEDGQFFMTLPLTALILSTIEDRPVVDNGAMVDRESAFSSVRSVSMCFGSDN